MIPSSWPHVCAYRITEFEATKTAPELQRYRVTPG